MLKAKIIKSDLSMEYHFNEFFKENPNCYILKFEHLVKDNNTEGFLVIYKEANQQPEPRLSPDEAPRCPKCNIKMQERFNSNKDEPFWGCFSYPKCRGSRPFSDADLLRFWGPEGDPGPASPPEDNEIPF